MATLTTAEQDKLPDSAFAIVKTVGGKKVRSYPIHDAAHARNALARVQQFGSPAERATVRKAVCGKYPSMGICASMRIADKLRGTGK